jgi:hypothetical protein
LSRSTVPMLEMGVREELPSCSPCVSDRPNRYNIHDDGQPLALARHISPVKNATHNMG